MKRLFLAVATLALLAVTGCEKHPGDNSSSFSSTGIFTPRGGDVANGMAHPAGVSQ